jgi:hypothetical protein
MFFSQKGSFYYFQKISKKTGISNLIFVALLKSLNVRKAFSCYPSISRISAAYHAKSLKQKISKAT